VKGEGATAGRGSWHGVDGDGRSALSEERKFAILIIGTLFTTNIAMCESTGSRSGQIA